MYVITGMLDMRELKITWVRRWGKSVGTFWMYGFAESAKKAINRTEIYLISVFVLLQFTNFIKVDQIAKLECMSCRKILNKLITDLVLAVLNRKTLFMREHYFRGSQSSRVYSVVYCPVSLIHEWTLEKVQGPSLNTKAPIRPNSHSPL